MANEGEASVKIVGDVRDFARQVEADLNRELRKIKLDPIKLDVDRQHLADAATDAGRDVGRNIGQGASEGIRSETETIARAGADAGRESGDRAGKSFGDRFKARSKTTFLDAAKDAAKGFSDVLGMALKGAGSAVIPVVSGIGTLVGGTFIAALAAVVLPAILGIVSAAVIALAGIGIGLGAIGLGAFALREVKPLVSAFKDLTKTVKDVGKESAQPILKPLISSIGTFKSLLKDLQPTFKSIFKSLAPAVEPLAKALGGFVKSVLGGIKDSMPGIVSVLEGFGKGFEYAGKVLGDFFRVIFGNADVLDNTTEAIFKLVFGPLKLLGPLISGLNVILGAWNNGLILFANSGIWDTILTGIMTFVDGGTGALGRIRDAWGPVADAIQNVWNKIKEFAAEDDPKKLEEKFLATVEAIRQAWAPIGEFLGVVWEEALAFLRRLWDEQFVPWWEETAKPWIQEAIGAAFQIAWDAAKAAVASKIAQIRGNISSGIASMINTIRTGMASVPVAIGNAFTTAHSRMRNILSSMAATTATGARTVISRLRTGLAVAHATVTGAFSGAAGWLISAGSSIINGLVSGIRGAFGRIRSAVSELGGLIPSWARGALNINSPSKVMIPIGESTMEGVEVGINRKRNDLRNMVQGIGSMIPAAATAGIGSGGGANVSGGLTFNINVSGVSGEQAGQRAAERVLKDLAAAGLVR